MFTLNGIILLLARYKYVLLFPLAIVEGPIITIIAGFFVTLGLFNPLVVYLLVIAGDMIGDSFLYMAGRGGGSLYRKFFSRSINHEKLEQTKLQFETHRRKALVMSKIIHGFGISGLVAAGSLKIPYGKFFVTCALVSLVQSAVLLTVGVLFGHAYLQLDKYLGYFGIATAIVGIGIITFLIVKRTSRASK